MVQKIFNAEPQKIKLLGIFFPAEALLEPDTIKDLGITGNVQRSLTAITGMDIDGAHLAQVSTDGALKVQAYGTGFRTYEVKTGTAPAAYNGSDLITTTEEFHRWLIEVQSDEALISFRSSDGVTWGGDIPILVGHTSYLFTGSGIRIKKRNTTAPDYTLIAFR